MAQRSSRGDGPVYSTQHGRLCPACARPLAQCACRKAERVPKSDGIVRVARETKGRNGKGVCLIRGVPLPEAGLEALAKDLKARCGSGGTVKDGVIEIQGDHRARLVTELEKRGWKVKIAGG